jgi:hypothetical protein
MYTYIDAFLGCFMSSSEPEQPNLVKEIRAINLAWMNLAIRTAKESPAECKIIFGLKQDEIKFLAETSSIDIASSAFGSAMAFMPRLSLKRLLNNELTARDYSLMVNKPRK